MSVVGDQEREFDRVKGDAIRLTLLSFDSDTAWEIGSAIRALAFATDAEKPMSISITHANSDQPMFFACSSPGVTPDHMHWVGTMRNAVKRWGKSTLYLHLQNPHWPAYEEGWKEKYSYVSGGWPVKVKGVEGVVAVIVVYGSAVDEFDNNNESGHNLIVQALEAVLRKQRLGQR